MRRKIWRILQIKEGVNVINRGRRPRWITPFVDCSQSPIFPCDRRCTCGSLNTSETGESTKCPWVGVVEGTAGGKNRETVKGRGRNWRLHWSNQLTVSSLEKKPVKSVSVAHEIDSMQLLSWVEQDEKSLVTARKRQSPQVQMRAVFVALISEFQSVITAERPNTFRPEFYLRSLNGLELTKFAWQFFWKYITVLKWIHKVENLPVNEKQPLFARALTPILHDPSPGIQD